MKLYVWIIVVAVGALHVDQVLAQSSKPQEGRPQDAVGWLNWMAKSAAETVFSGTYIYQYGTRMETSRVTHAVDEAGEHEKVETLDGLPREIIRKNDEIV